MDTSRWWRLLWFVPVGIRRAAFGVREQRSPLPWSPTGAKASLLVALGVVFAGAMFGGAVAQIASTGVGLGIAWALGALQALPLLLAVRVPLVAWRISTIGMLFAVTGQRTESDEGTTVIVDGDTITYLIPPGNDGSSFWPWAVTAFIAYLVLQLAVALRHDRQVTTGVGVVTSAVVLFKLASAPLPVIAIVIVGVILVLMLGSNIRGQQQARRSLAEQEARRAALEGRQAILEERSRIARELHDVVAHHMSMVAIQAEAAPYKIHDLPDDARRTFGVIREASTTALTEMRRVIGLLRDDTGGADRLPQPGLTHLTELVAGARDAGVSIDMTVTGDLASVPDGVDLSAYRIVQEALSNASRHAPGSPVDIDITREPTLLRIRVHNGPPDRTVTGSSGGGHGLVGMRERVSMLDGTLHTGPTAAGGFEVVAVLPLETVQEDE